MAKSVRAVVSLFLMIFMVACSGNSPTAPAPPAPRPNPQPILGTQAQQYTLEGTNESFYVWITGFSPSPGATAKIGDRVSFGYACGGPSGHSVMVSAVFMSNDVVARDGSAFDPNRVYGDLFRSSPNCEGIRTSPYVDITAKSKPITHIIFRFWSSTRPVESFDETPRPPQATYRQDFRVDLQ